MKTTSFILACAAVFGARSAAAQSSQLYVKVGLDPAVVTSIGYSHDMGSGFQIGVEGGLAGGEFDVSDFRARIELQALPVKLGDLRFGARIASITSGTKNTIYDAISFGAELSAVAGIYRKGWFAGGEFGKEKAVVTHVTNSAYYRDAIYPDAKDGWYLDAGGNFKYGVMGGFNVGRAALSARAGMRRTEKWNQVTPPFYASIGLGVGL